MLAKHHQFTQTYLLVRQLNVSLTKTKFAYQYQMSGNYVIKWEFSHPWFICLFNI